MSTIVRLPRRNPLTAERYASVIAGVCAKLVGRVHSAYVFGSAGTPEMTIDSDIDLLLVVPDVERVPFVERGLAFSDLHELFPALDLLVYSPSELDRQLSETPVGFWKSVRLSMRKIC